MIKNILLLLRPQQWLKNGFIFLPLFFGGRLFDWGCWLSALYAFGAFCFVASSIYCFNDIHDVEADRMHPVKCLRPIACGAISVKSGYLLMAVCVLTAYVFIALGSFSCQKLYLYGFITCYLLMNISYCVWLKYRAVIDVVIISLGFVLRLLMGGWATGIPLSQWIVMMTFLLALFLAFAKRRDDVVMYEDTGVLVRQNVNRYNLAFMNQLLGIVASVTMVCYIMYTVSDEVVARVGSRYLYLTSVFVLTGIIRYLQITIVNARSGSPTQVLLHDRFLQLCVIGWLIAFVTVLYW